MTKAAQRIREIAEGLAPDRRQILLDVAESLARPSQLYDTLTPEQRGELDQAIREAGRGEGVEHGELEARLDRVTGRSDA